MFYMYRFSLLCTGRVIFQYFRHPYFVGTLLIFFFLPFFQDGTFLVRVSKKDTKFPYTLVVYHKGSANNLHIRMRNDGKYALGVEKADELVCFVCVLFYFFNEDCTLTLTKHLFSLCILWVHMNTFCVHYLLYIVQAALDNYFPWKINF